MSETRKQIFEAANKCFMQYGFSKTSLKMVSELSGLSRVTIYKHFDNKDNLFREVLVKHMEELACTAEESLRHETIYWRKLERLIDAWVISPLETLASDMVINDLKHAGKQVGENILVKWYDVLQDNLNAITQEAAREGEIDPAKLGMSSERISMVIGIMIHGLANRNVSDLRQGVADIIDFLKATLKS